jgi:hypothetical protein
MCRMDATRTRAVSTARAFVSRSTTTLAQRSCASREHRAARSAAASAFPTTCRAPRISASASRVTRRRAVRESTAAMRVAAGACRWVRDVPGNSAHLDRHRASRAERVLADRASIAATKAAEFARPSGVAASSSIASRPVMSGCRVGRRCAPSVRFAATRAAASVRRQTGCASCWPAWIERTGLIVTFRAPARNRRDHGPLDCGVSRFLLRRNVTVLAKSPQSVARANSGSPMTRLASASACSVSMSSRTMERMTPSASMKMWVGKL